MTSKFCKNCFTQIANDLRSGFRHFDFLGSPCLNPVNKKNWCIDLCLSFELFSEERTSSTHALTMFRYNYTIKNQTYKVGKSLSFIHLFLSRLATSNNCLLTYYWICFDSLQTFGIRRARSLSTNCTRLTTLGPTCALWYSMWRARWPTRICATGMLRWGISVPTFHASALQTRSICRNRLSIAGTSSLRRLIALSNLFQPPMERMLWQSSSKLLKLVCTTRKIPMKMTSWTIFWTYSTTRSQQDV